jgi:hypothetical protein
MKIIPLSNTAGRACQMLFIKAIAALATGAFSLECAAIIEYIQWPNVEAPGPNGGSFEASAEQGGWPFFRP